MGENASDAITVRMTCDDGRPSNRFDQCPCIGEVAGKIVRRSSIRVAVASEI
jgi:hypothetical protein